MYHTCGTFPSVQKINKPQKIKGEMSVASKMSVTSKMSVAKMSVASKHLSPLMVINNGPCSHIWCLAITIGLRISVVKSIYFHMVCNKA